MKILLTGVSGYIGARLLPLLLEAGHQVVVLARDKTRLALPKGEGVEVVEGDLLNEESLRAIPSGIDCAYYLVHSMHTGNFEALEEQQIRNFLAAVTRVGVKQIIYLTGLISSNELSAHLRSRLQVEEAIKASGIPYTVFRAGIVIGSGSASFEIIRDLSEKLPIMITPRWVKSRCQPISVHDVIAYLTKAAGHTACTNRVFDIGGPDVLTYKEMLLGYARARGLRRWIIPVPVLTPTLSSYWLFLVTSTNFRLATALVQSLKNDAICSERSIDEVIPQRCLTYQEALERAFLRIEQNAVFSSWTDAMEGSRLAPKLAQYIAVPRFGCYTDTITLPLQGSRSKSIDRLWRIGGKNGWYAYDALWRLRGTIDKVCGGIGLRRGRRDEEELRPGDALDFWRVLIADKEKGHLLLYAEMKLPGEAWLECTLSETSYCQKAVFRPKGVFGRLYWYALLPLHHILFKKMAQATIKE